MLGRDFLPDDDRPSVTKAVILGDALWRREFGADPRVLGQVVRVNGRAGVIVGVMPPGFAFPINEQLWIPLNTEFPPRPRNDPNIQTVNLIGRLKPGVSVAQANAEMMTLARTLAAEFTENKQFSLGWVRPIAQFFNGPQLVGLLYTMLAFCLGVLLIACGNVMNMQFARATLRARELAIRSSLGATRTRLVRQMLTESLLLATLGAVAGIALSAWSIDWLESTVHGMTNPIPSWIHFRLDPAVLGLIVAATGLSALVSGLLPALVASRANAVDVLKESGRGHTGRTVGLVTKGLVVSQVVVTCVLLIGALLQVQSIVRQEHADFGYDATGVLSARLGLMEGDYPDNPSRVGFYERLLPELRADPSFASAALSSRFQMIFGGRGNIEIEGQIYREDKDRPSVNFENISDDYFATLGQRLLAGRDLRKDDNDPKLPVAIVNATFAHKYFGNDSPLGRRFRPVWDQGRQFNPWRTIVGVVSDVRMLNPFDGKNDNAGYYVPLSASLYAGGDPIVNGPQFASLVVRSRDGVRPESLDRALRAAVHRVDPNLPLYFVATPRTNLDGQLGGNRLVASMFSIFGAVAVILASAGLYGVTSFSVNQRTQEFGIRMALGADHRTVLRMVLRQGAWQIGLGLALGLGFAYLAGSLGAEGLSQALYRVDPHDPLIYTGVALLLLGVSFAAMFLPARRATKVDPMIALRAE